MRIALIRNHDLCLNSRQMHAMQKRAGVLPHLGLSYIEAALLREGHVVTQLDAQAFGLDSIALKKALQAFVPDLVGVTTTTPGMPGAVEACKISKEIGATVILGGPHTEVYGRENLYHSCIDFVGVGEGVSIMVDLADALSEGKDPSTIPGLVSREFENLPAKMMNLQDMGWPNRTSVPIELYHSIMAKRPFTTMISSRGCPFQCSFCFKQSVDRKSIYRTADDVVSEMEHLVKTYAVKEIMFYDDIFTMKRKRVVEICNLINDRKLKVRWEAPTRVDLVDDELLKLMRKAGCIRLRFGIESGDIDILRDMQKSTDIEKIHQAVIGAKKAGIQTFAYFIVGWLNESIEQYQRTVDMALRLPLDYASFYTATPLPGTTLFKSAVKAGMVAEDYWLRYIRGEETGRIGFLAPSAEERAREAYKRFYMRPRKLPTILKHASGRKMLLPVVSGVVSLMKSNGNTFRDI